MLDDDITAGGQDFPSLRHRDLETVPASCCRRCCGLSGLRLGDLKSSKNQNDDLHARHSNRGRSPPKKENVKSARRGGSDLSPPRRGGERCSAIPAALL